MELWILGYITDEKTGQESSIWEFLGIFYSRENALLASRSIQSNHPEGFFIAPVSIGNILMQDIIDIPGFEYILKASD